jgi:hypothetical protein
MVLMTRKQPEVCLDVEGNLSVGDRVQFNYEGTTVTGYLAQFIRNSYLFVDDRGNCRTYAHVVRHWEHRHDRTFGWFVLLSELKTQL